MSGARNYAIVTASYWGFTLTDGALRMLVLLHFFRLGYTPFTLAFLFLLYEAAGILANLGGGWLASRFGIPRMLAVGLGLQIAGLLLLSALDPGWDAVASVTWVIVAQGIAGVAKDITKTASKSAIKATAVSGTGQLFRWVAWFTGSKNAMKGVGFFLGGLLLDVVGFRHALWLMAWLLAAILIAGWISLTARIFLFGARDVWFVVGLPVFLYAQGWRFLEVGAFLAAWTIAYGGIQALAPSLVARSADGLSREVVAARVWAAILAVVPAILALAVAVPGGWRPDIVVVVGLTLFALAFAVNSSLHSYLILAYAGSKKAAEDVGFYYAANATGRLCGTLLSGLLYQAGGLAACLAGSAIMLGTCWGITFLLPSHATEMPATPA